MKYYKTSSLPKAAYLVCKGFKCLGSIPDKSDETGRRKMFVIEYDIDKRKDLNYAIDDFYGDNNLVRAHEFYAAQKAIKHYINDFEEV